MKTLKHSINISASPEEIWNAIFSPDCFKKWGAEFGPDPNFSGTWEEGTEMHFYDSDHNGMVALVEKCDLHKTLVLRYVACLAGGKKDVAAIEKMDWKDHLEKYLIEEKENGCTLQIESDTGDEFVEAFTAAWPRALNRIKDMAEAG